MARDNCSFYKDQKSFAGITEAILQKHIDRGFSRDQDGFKYERQLKVNMIFTGDSAYKLNKKILFKENSFISERGIKAIELTSVSNLAVNTTIPQTDQIPTAWFASAFLCIVDDCDMDILKIPLTSLCLATNGNKLAMFDIKNINWGACYVRFTQNQGVSTSNSLQFNIYQ